MRLPREGHEKGEKRSFVSTLTHSKFIKLLVAQLAINDWKMMEQIVFSCLKKT